jgi:hypothetical protein
MEETRRLLDGTELSDDEALAKEVLHWLRESWPKTQPYLFVSALTNGVQEEGIKRCPKIRSAEKAHRAINYLVEQGVLQPTESKQVVFGRQRTHVWKVCL